MVIAISGWGGGLISNNDLSFLIRKAYYNIFQNLFYFKASGKLRDILLGFLSLGFLAGFLHLPAFLWANSLNNNLFFKKNIKNF